MSTPKPVDPRDPDHLAWLADPPPTPESDWPGRPPEELAPEPPSDDE